MILVEDFIGSRSVNEENSTEFLHRLDLSFNSNAAYVSALDCDWYLFIMVRDEFAYVVACNDVSSRCLVAKASERIVERSIVFIENPRGAESEVPAEVVIPVETAKRIVETFARTKALSSDVNWQEL